MFDYESPITQILGEMQTKFDGEVMSIVQNYGIHVDKEELVRALAYDRGQYDKGYADASADLDLLLNELIVPMEIENVCEELNDWDLDEDYESWCGRNCGVFNDGSCPSAECYKAWIRMKKGE